MTTKLEDAEELCRLVAKHRTIFALTHNYTGYPMVKQARELVRQGKLGEIKKIVAEYPQGWLAGATGISMWRLDPEGRGHLVRRRRHRTARVASRAVHLGARGRSRSAPTSPRSAAATSWRTTRTCSCTIEGGARGIIYSSQMSVGEENGLRVRIYGTKAGLDWKQENPNYLELLHGNGPVHVYRRGNDYLGPIVEAQLAAAVRPSRGVHRGVRQHLSQRGAHDGGAHRGAQAGRVRHGLPDGAGRRARRALHREGDREREEEGVGRRALHAAGCGRGDVRGTHPCANPSAGVTLRLITDTEDRRRTGPRLPAPVPPRQIVLGQPHALARGRDARRALAPCRCAARDAAHLLHRRRRRCEPPRRRSRLHADHAGAARFTPASSRTHAHRRRVGAARARDGRGLHAPVDSRYHPPGARAALDAHRRRARESSGAGLLEQLRRASVLAARLALVLWRRCLHPRALALDAARRRGSPEHDEPGEAAHSSVRRSSDSSRSARISR